MKCRLHSHAFGITYGVTHSVKRSNPSIVMNTPLKLPALVFAAVALAASAHADWLDKIKSVLTSTNAPTAAGALSSEQMVGGLKEALSKGVEKAVASLGRENGFLTNLNVKIPMPEKLQSVEKTLRAVGQNQLADDFIGSMNHAAEQAVPVAAGVFGDAIKQMTIADAKAILSSTNDAATQFFRRTTQTNLHAKFYPIVQKATDQVGVTAQYKQMTSKLAAADTLGGLFSRSASTKLGTADIDAYVTDKALDGLFKMVAEEEKNIRANPLARTSDLLQKVFGAATK